MPAEPVRAVPGDRGVTSSYDQPEEYISMDQYRQSMRMVRLQIAIPISVLINLGTNLVCALIIHPGIGKISDLHPTLMTPNRNMTGIYIAVLFGLQIGLCLLLMVHYSDYTKATLVNGVGLRFAVANWLMSAWAVCFVLQFFKGAVIIMIINAVLVLSIHLTLYTYPPTLRHPFDYLFIHTGMAMFVAILLGLGWMHSGFIAMDWIITDKHCKNSKNCSTWIKWVWPAIGCVAGVNGVVAIWNVFTRQYVLAAAFVYVNLCLLLESPRINPTQPDSELPKPPSFIITLIICAVLHPVAIAAGEAIKYSRNREGRIRLEEEVEEAEERARAAEGDHHRHVHPASQGAGHA